MDDFIKYFKRLNSIGKTPSKDHAAAKPTEQAELAKTEINRYREKYAGIDLQVLSKLIALKDISNSPKTEQPDEAFKKIEHYLGEKESAETLRQERWPDKIHCPFCNSTNIKQLKPANLNNKYVHKYLCLECNETFTDESGTEIEENVPPLHSWMFCWYLLGCTSSLQYIATKLGLELSTVERMVIHLQELFKSDKPLTHFMSFDEWNLLHGKNYKSVMQAALSKKRELYTAVSPGQEQDTAELRRQKQRNRNPHKPKPG